MLRALSLVIPLLASTLAAPGGLGAKDVKPFKRVVGGIAYPCRVNYVRSTWPELCLTSSGGLTSDVVTTGPDLETEPAWSPEGMRLAYVVSGRLEVKSIWLQTCGEEEDCLSYPGKIRRVATAGPASAPDWSPSGSQLVYVGRSGGNADLYVLPAAGGSSTRLTRNAADDVDPAWSPNGRAIAFSRASTLYAIDVKRRSERALGTGRKPAWSPDGKQLAFEWQGDIWTARADGSGRRNITGSSAVQETDPTWAPDGGRVAFPGLPAGEAAYDMYIVRPGRAPIRFRTGGDMERPFVHPSVDWQEIASQLGVTVQAKSPHIVLRDYHGHPLRSIRAGTLAMKYVDRSPGHGFAVSVKDFSPGRSVRFVGRLRYWGVPVKPGVYRYWCPAHPKTERGTFRVVDSP